MASKAGNDSWKRVVLSPFTGGLQQKCLRSSDWFALKCYCSAIIFSSSESFEKNIVLVLGGLDKGNSNFFNPINYCKKKIRFASCYGESGEYINNQIKNIVETNYTYSFSDAVLDAVSHLRNDDVLLLSPGCASFDQFDNYESRGDKFKEIIMGLA